MKKLIITLLLGIISLVGFSQPTYEDDYTKEAIILTYNYASIYNIDTKQQEERFLEQRHTFVFYPNSRVVLQYREDELIDRFTMLTDSYVRDVTENGEEYVTTKVITYTGRTEILQIFQKEHVLREILNDGYIEYRMNL